MPFNTLLLSCLQPAQTVLEDSKTKVWLKGIKTDETVLVFESDDQSNPRCRLRQFLWGNLQGQRLCDFIVFYAKDSQPIICFVELKDNKNDFGDAIIQVTNTYQAFKTHLTLPYKAKAFIAASGGSVPKEHYDHQESLSNIFKPGNYQYDGGQVDFLDFLRGTLQPKSKFKKGNVRR